MTIVHAGAHFGEEADEYERLGAERVVWVEAAPDTFECLQQNVADRNRRSLLQRALGLPATEHICINALLGDSDGSEMEFVRFNRGVADSVFHLATEFAKDATHLEETGERISLPMRRLDSALEDVGVPPGEVDCLVMDIQGAELLCLKGALKALQGARFIASEINRTPMYEGGVLLDELDEWLRDRGFVRKTLVRKDCMNAIYAGRRSAA